MNSEIGIGNQLNRLARDAVQLLFAQGELAMLSHAAYDQAATAIQDGSAATGLSRRLRPLTSSAW